MEFLRNLLSGPTIGIIIAIIAIVVILMTGYLKAPPDTAIIISGIGKKPRILIGRAGLRIPFFERIDRLTLKQININFRTEDYIPTKDYINITVDAVAKVHVDMEKIAVAMTNFLNKSEDEIIADLQGTLQGNMREIIGTMYLKEICNDRSSFSDKVKESASPNMSNLGIEILSCNIQTISDRNNLIEDMGMDNTSKIKKDAAIAKAESERDVAIAEAQAKKAANDARVEAETQIAEKNNQLAIKQSQLKISANDARVEAETQIAEKNNQLAIKQSQLKISADMKKAEADAAYKIQEQEQRRTIEVNSVNADIARQEREAELKKVEVQVTEQALDAEVKKKADAEQYAQQKRAEVELFQRQRC